MVNRDDYFQNYKIICKISIILKITLILKNYSFIIHKHFILNLILNVKIFFNNQ